MKELASGTVFCNQDLYNFLEKTFPQECIERGYAPREAQFRNDARWVVQDAKRVSLVKDTGKIGEHQRPDRKISSLDHPIIKQT